jgi:hypothetical protein
MILNPTKEQRSACSRAADLVTHQAEGLRLTGSKTTVAALQEYAALLRKIAAGAPVEFSEKDRVGVEQASFVLEGIRDGLLTAEFRDRAKVLDADIRALNDIVSLYNASS